MVTPIEDRLQNIQVRLLTSRRYLLHPESWTLDILSPFWRLYVNHRPGASLWAKGEHYPLLPGSIYLIPAWVRFQTAAREAICHDYLHFYLTGVPPALHQQLFDRVFALAGCPELDMACVRWQGELEHSPGQPQPAGFFWGLALIHGALAQTWKGLSQSARDAGNRWILGSEKVRPALEQMERHLAEPPLNRDLAARCHMSEDHFIRVFRDAMGMTPARYGVERRLDASAHWLAATDRTVEDIAESAGFADRFHFSRLFKKAFGLPPVAYRKLHLREKPVAISPVVS